MVLPDGVRERLQPNHKVLVLKCYPRLSASSAAAARPNSSELSYLLHYAAARNQKLQKVGDFLENKTYKDLWAQSARVHVTLKIITAILEHSAINNTNPGLPNFVPQVLRIIRHVIKNTNDVGLIEATLDTWAAVCACQYPRATSANRAYHGEFDTLVDEYARLAHNDYKVLGGAGHTAQQRIPYHDALRLRKVGVVGVRCAFEIATSLERESSWVRNSTFKVASNITDIRPDQLVQFNAQLNKREEEQLKGADPASRRPALLTRPTQSAPDPRAARGSAQDADKLEMEELVLLTLSCLKVVFKTESRTQIRSGADAFLCNMEVVKDCADLNDAVALIDRCTTIYRVMTSWTPAQSRSTLLNVAVERLGSSDLDEEQSDPSVHLLYTKCIQELLRSDMTLHGLPVVDVLLHLIRATHRVATRDHRPESSNKNKWNRAEYRTIVLDQLRDCMAALATHLYYSNQINDCISTILSRIKPESPSSSLVVPEPGAATVATNTATNTANSTATKLAILDGWSVLHEDAVSHATFTSERERLLALDAVRQTLQIAQSLPDAKAGIISRTPVPASIWHGSQWLVRDPAPLVQAAYRDLVALWAELEDPVSKQQAWLDLDTEDWLAEFQARATEYGIVNSSNGIHFSASSSLDPSSARRSSSITAQVQKRLQERESRKLLALERLKLRDTPSSAPNQQALTRPIFALDEKISPATAAAYVLPLKSAWPAPLLLHVQKHSNTERQPLGAQLDGGAGDGRGGSEPPYMGRY